MTEWHAQAGQDKWVIETLGREPGFFIDVGAHDGITHSNTFTLETEFEWHGICIEPDHEAFGRLSMIRSATNDGGSACVFGAASGRSGSGRMEGDRLVLDVTGGTKVYTIDELLEKFRAPKIIDYLSIDVEGHEVEVLRGIDFERYYFRAITIEHNLYADGRARKNAIFEYLTSYGFVRVHEDVIAPGYGPYEDWYVSRSVLPE